MGGARRIDRPDAESAGGKRCVGRGKTWENGMSADRIRLAMVGCGGMAGAHLGGYEHLHSKGIGSFEIAAVCDPETERAEKFRERVARWSDATSTADGPAVYADLEEMLRRE